jgi:hypothetical protein
MGNVEALIFIAIVAIIWCWRCGRDDPLPSRMGATRGAKKKRDDAHKREVRLPQSTDIGSVAGHVR